MSPFRRSFARSYGAAAISWWSWLVTLPFALSVMSGLQYIQGGPLAVLAVASLQHGILGGLLLLGAAFLRLVHGRWRPVAVYAVFAVVGGTRPLLSLEAGGLLGIPVAAGDLVGRIAINVVAMVVAFGLVAVGVDLVRDHRAVFRRLRAAQHASERDIACAGDRLTRLRATAVDDVVAAMEEAAASASAEQLDAAQAARLLRTLAQDVVRPASHRVYESAGLEGASDAEPPTRREWSRSVLGGMRAAPALPVALLFTLLVLPFAVVLYGAETLFPVVVDLALLFGAGAAVERLPLPSRTLPRLIALFAAYAAVGGVLVLVSTLVLSLVGADTSGAWFQVLNYPFIALAVAFVGALTERVRLDQADLESALQSNVATAAHIRADYDRERASLARLLHAGVQSELIAGALALASDPTSGPEAAAQRLAEIVGRARDALRGGGEEPRAVDEVRAVIESWSSAIDLRARVGDDVWDRLADPARASAVVDAVSEGLANAVRHGDGSPVAVELRPVGDAGVEVLIESGGTLTAGAEGIGLRQLAERGTVALRQAAGRVELAVAIP